MFHNLMDGRLINHSCRRNTSVTDSPLDIKKTDEHDFNSEFYALFSVSRTNSGHFHSRLRCFVSWSYWKTQDLVTVFYKMSDSSNNHAELQNWIPTTILQELLNH